jgi:hypothetical protein
MRTIAPALILQISLTAGLLLFIRDLWTLAPLDHALMTAGGVGAVLYAALMGGWAVARHALSQTPAEPPAPAPAPVPAAPSDAPPAGADRPAAERAPAPAALPERSALPA